MIDLSPGFGKLWRSLGLGMQFCLESLHTSIKERVDHAKAEGRIADVSEIRNGSVAATAVSDGVEGGLWLIPIEDRRKQGVLREGMREGFTLGQYLGSSAASGAHGCSS